MKLPADIARCAGTRCPARANCRRYTERLTAAGQRTLYAAFYARREAGADSCDQMLPVTVVTTFKA